MRTNAPELEIWVRAAPQLIQLHLQAERGAHDEVIGEVRAASGGNEQQHGQKPTQQVNLTTVGGGIEFHG